MFYHLEFHQMNFAIFIASIMNIVKAIIITITLRMNFFQPGRESHLLANKTSDSPPTTSIRPTNAYAPIIIESIRVIPGKISKYASTPHITEVVMPTKSFFFPEARDKWSFLRDLCYLCIQRFIWVIRHDYPLSRISQRFRQNVDY